MSNTTLEPIILFDGTIRNSPIGYGSNTSVNEPEKPKKSDGKYYESSIASLDTKNEKAQAEKPKSTGFFDWCSSVYNWIGDKLWGKTAEAKSVDKISNDKAAIEPPAQVPLNPELKPPAKHERSKNIEALLRRQRELAEILDQQYKDYEELEKLGNVSFENFLKRATHTVFMQQRDIKQDVALQDGKKLKDLQNDKKDIHQRKAVLVDDFIEKSKTNKTLHWVNFSTTCGLLGIAAVAIAPWVLGLAPLSGALVSALGYTSSLLMISKGGVSLGETYTEYRTGKISGEILMAQHDSKTVDVRMRDRIALIKDAFEEDQRLTQIYLKIRESEKETIRAFTAQINA